jgi:hypothetical protein
MNLKPIVHHYYFHKIDILEIYYSPVYQLDR